MSTEGLILSFMIYVMGVQEVATADIPGSLLQTKYENVDIHIKLEGAIIILLEQTDPDYYKYLSKKIKSQ